MKFLGYFEKAIEDSGKDGFAVSSSVSLLYIYCNMCRTLYDQKGSIFFPVRVANMKIENNF